MSALLAAFPINTFAQAPHLASFTAADMKAEADAIKIDTKSKGKFEKSVAAGWVWVSSQCTGTPISDQCAAASLVMVSNECSASASFFKKDSKTWQYVGLGLLLASAIFTGIGASATIKSAKVWSTLGGTTGLGSITASVNANVTSDQAGVSAVNAMLTNFITYVTTGGANKGTAPPVISTATSASGTVGSVFSYQIVATNSPTSYSATGLPVGLSVNTTTGLISGTPTAAGSSTVTLGATNVSGTGNSTLMLIFVAVAAAAPIIFAATSASGTVGSPFSYQIAATNLPTSYSATGLPADLSVNATGLISGTPTAAGTSTITLGATNASGTGNSALTLTIASAGGPAVAPVITSAASASGRVGSAFSYQIAATNSPTSYSATGLPTGLSVDATGLIFGTPSAPGTSTVTLGATNAGGTGNSTLALTINAAAPGLAAPGVTSAASASGTVGSAFSYQIAATNSPTDYSATGLPTGLSVNATTGLISGTPTSTGSSTITLGATNAGGTGNSTLTLNVGTAAPPPNSAAAPNELIYKVAPLYAAECSAAAMASSAK
ncbi:MAG: putative Ig domain-containing protein [Acidobacteriaceae bacterium]|nr:putative Ig domain-containing protein [Acidobacteriaceae bacterium]